jgi:hypothetical protein
MEISFGKSILHPNEYASGVCKRDPEWRCKSGYLKQQMVLNTEDFDEIA